VYRLFLRLKAVAGIGSSCFNRSERWQVRDFVQEVCPDVSSAVVLVGTSGPAQKLVIELWNPDQVVAYVKYAEMPRARVRLNMERDVLRALPGNLGPTVLKYGCLGKGEALLLTPIPGCEGRAQLPLTDRIARFFQSLPATGSFEINEHPWIQTHRKRFDDKSVLWINSLSRRTWRVQFNHGDAAPWNLKNTDASTMAIDWEYGTPEGFPFMDLVHYILRIAYLIYRWSPPVTRRYVVDYLVRSHSLERDEALALTSLTANYDYLQALEDGHPPDTNPQLWRRQLWNL
jgi:hypothetical protein